MLDNRTLRVRVGDTLSPSFDHVEGFPQGSILSVLCFALAMNDMLLLSRMGLAVPLT